MKQSIRGLRARIEQLAGERERAEKDSLEHTRLWQERAEGLKAQGLQVTYFLCRLRTCECVAVRQPTRHWSSQSSQATYTWFHVTLRSLNAALCASLAKDARSQKQDLRRTLRESQGNGGAHV